MAQPWNLTQEQWSKVLDDGSEAKEVAKRLMTTSYLPWNEVLLKLTKDSLTTCDLGCGRGEHSAILALHGKETTLVDWSDENLDFCRKLYEAIQKRGEFLRADITQRLPFADRSFDTVFSCGVFEYFTDEQIKNILKELFRIAKKRVVIMVPNALSIPYRIGKWYMQKNNQWPWGGERPFASLKKYFPKDERIRIQEFTVAAKHSLNFLTMPKGKQIKGYLIKSLNLADHSKPSLLRQGYLLISVGERV